MSKFTKFVRANPEAAALLRRLIVYALNGGTAAERNELLREAVELDSDGDGIPDAQDTTPHGNTPAPRTRKPRAKRG